MARLAGPALALTGPGLGLAPAREDATQEDAQDEHARSARDAELSEVLASYVEPRAVSYRFVTGFVVVGLLASVSVAWWAARAPERAPVRLEQHALGTFSEGIEAFKKGDWDEAERLLRRARAESRVAPQRLDDYLVRLALIRRDGERLTRAEQALDSDAPERALLLAALVPANSPLFAQAEVLSRSALALVEASQRADEQNIEPASATRARNLTARRGAAQSPKQQPQNRANW